MNNPLQPQLLNFSRIGEPALGYISVAEIQKDIPFEMNRIFWTYYTPESVMRGGHAHHFTEMILIAAAGTITVHTEMPDGTKQTFVLDQPNKGVYLPVLCWHTMQYTHNAIQLVIASTVYQQEDYIRDYETFKQLNG